MKISNPENIDFQCIDNIIFDWGGVITNIDLSRTVEAFDRLGLKNFNEFFTNHRHNDLLNRYETGMISSDDFLMELKSVLPNNVTYEEIRGAWCALLLDTPAANIEMLRKLADKFNLYLLSNTSEIHVKYYQAILQRDYNTDHAQLFQKVYYSHETGIKKPEIGMFKIVLDELGLKPEKTLFIDDTEINIDASASLGIMSFHINGYNSMGSLFKEL